MPRKTKEIKEEVVKKEAKTKKKATTSTTNSNAKKKAATKKVTTPTKKTTTSSAKKNTTKKSTTAVKKTTTKKSTANKSTSKKTTKTTKSTKVNKEKVKAQILEYYDLPYRYNQTVVKVLAQTPTNLFIYWDISDADRENFKNQYGENFFENSKPILIVHNNTLNYSFEVEINDFANSWYLHVTDSKCDYKIELGRRPIVKNEKLNVDYVYVSTSNAIESPNDRILFNKEQQMVYFRNVKTGQQTGKSINNISFIRNMGKIYNIYDLYKAIYKNENVEDIYDLSNPSSNPSSDSFSSKFTKEN